MSSRLISLLAEVLNVRPETVTDQLAMKNVDGWDSLRHMEVVAAIEHAFMVELSFDEIVQMREIGAIKHILRAKGIDV